jgi:uncharacterized protein YlxW (UPF0749 family)
VSVPDDVAPTPGEPTPETSADVGGIGAETGPVDREVDAADDGLSGVEPEAEQVDAVEPDAVQRDAVQPDVEPHEAPVQRLKRSFRPTVSRSQVMVGLLCALLGFAVVVQVRQSGQETLSSLRQDDLVRLLDEVTVRADQLDGEVARLRTSRDELASGSGQAQAALDVARQRATSEGILSGRLPAQGPGVVVTIREPDAANQLKAQHLFNLLEELRNAGAEVVQVNDVRLVASSSFVDGSDGTILVDGVLLTRPYRWRVIGDPATLDRALEIPGGALPTIRSAGGSAVTEQLDEVTIDAVVELTDPRFAQPAPDGENG